MQENCQHWLLSGYGSNSCYFGVLVGRVANRICKGKFTLEGKTYQLNINNGPNALHGGPHGYQMVNPISVLKSNMHILLNQRLWSASVDGTKLILKLVDRDGEENYPGTVQVTVTYELTADSALHINYVAETDQATPINLTNHSYFNLGGKVSLINCSN
jgi:aldose 1-epimerase